MGAKDDREAVYEAIRSRYPSKAYALMLEVPNATGFPDKKRSADAVAMSLWPSRGLELHGLEVKVTREDWLRELKDPAKAESILRYVDRWWLVVSDASLVAKGELPAKWGLLVLKGGKLVVGREAPKLRPRPVDREFLASLMRQVTEQCGNEAELERSRKAGYEQGLAFGERVGKHASEQLELEVAAFEAASGLSIRGGRKWEAGRVGDAVRELLSGGILTLRDRVKEFEESSGLDINDYNAGNIGEAVRLVLGSGGRAGVHAKLERLKAAALALVEEIDEAKRVPGRAESSS